MNDARLQELQQTYQHNARWHDRFTAVYSLGQEKRLRREIVSRMNLNPGDTVLDVACGTGLNFEALQNRIRSSGQIIGLDYSDTMLSYARSRIEQHHWRNVSLQQGDATQLNLKAGSVNAALCTLAIGLMPDPRLVLERMLEALRPGGILLIADGKLSTRWYGPLINPILRTIGSPWLPPYSRRQYWAVHPWEDLQDLLKQVIYIELLGGTLYVAYGRKGNSR
jgi:ubiquinone/menaquinone biosynthesis C-methylase UbiE